MNARHRENYEKPPKKGTKARKILLMMLRKKGATKAEIIAEIGPIAWNSVLFTLREFKGYDIRVFSPKKRWRLVGKMRFDGRYRSFIEKSVDTPAR